MKYLSAEAARQLCKNGWAEISDFRRLSDLASVFSMAAIASTHGPYRASKLLKLEENRLII